MKMLTADMLHLYCIKCSNWRPITWTQVQRCHFHSSVTSSTTVCCTPDQTALEHCCSCFFKNFQSHSKWSLSILCCKFFDGFVSSKSSNLHGFV